MNDQTRFDYSAIPFGVQRIGRFIRTKRKSYSLLLGVIYAVVIIASLIFVLIFVYHSSFARQLAEIDQQISDELNKLIRHSTILTAQNQTVIVIPRLVDAIQRKVSRQSESPTNSTLFILATEDEQRYAGNLSRLPLKQVQFGELFEFEFTVVEKDLDKHDSDVGGMIESKHTARAQALLLKQEYVTSVWRRFSYPQSDYVLLVGRDITDIKELESLLFRVFVLSLFITLVLAIVGAVLTSMVISRRLVKINQTCRMVIDGNFSHRIDTNGSEDGFDQLADNFNDMLSQIEALMEEIRRVSDNIAHDLITPLNRLRNRLEKLALESEKASSMQAQDQQSIEAAIQDADAMLSTFKALLRISKVESKSLTDNVTKVNSQELVDDVFEYYEPYAEERDVQMERFIDAECVDILADRDLVFQAIANLLDNAIKFTPAKGQVRIEGIKHAKGFEIVVSDSGPGIPAEFHEKVCRRFYRLDSSRTTAGNGLGLSLVSAIARYHNLELVFEDNQPGLKARLRYFQLAL